jgi:transketolase
VDSYVIVDHRTWAECGDGDLMEGVASEACSLAGHLGLGKLTLLYDENHVTLDGPTTLSFTEEVAARFLAYGWHVVRLFDVDDFAAIDAAFAEAKAETERPSIILMHSHIGVGTPLHDDHRAHGSPVGPSYAGIARGLLGWPYDPFVIPREIYNHWREQVNDRAVARPEWDRRFEAYRADQPELATEFQRAFAGVLPERWRTSLPRFTPGARISTRVAAGKTLNALAAVIPELLGGAGDLESSTETHLIGHPNVTRTHRDGRNLYFGVREHGMGGIVNGMAAHGGLRPFGATFFCFSDYMRPSVRLSAIMRLPVVWVWTHDSIGLGEDGTTHQPVEHLASLRAMPHLRLIRPADANEAAQAWAAALDYAGPTGLVLSRQSLPVLDPDLVDVRGAVVADGDDATIVATGSEVEVALQARDLLAADGIGARVVSLPCWDLFRERPDDERVTILPPGRPTVAVEAASPMGWREFADDVVAMTTFGASGKAADLYEHFGITPPAVAARVRALLHR